MNKFVKMILIGVCVFTMPNLAVSGALKKADFRATVSPAILNLSVNASGGIVGDLVVQVRVQRIKRNRVRSCNSIKYLEVVRGGDFTVSDRGSDFLERLSMMPRGRCFFDTTMHVTPFSNEDVRDICTGIRSGTTKHLVRDGLVTAWNNPSVPSLHRMWDNGGSGGVPKNQARVTFKANVRCGGAVAGATRPPKVLVKACNMSNWWKLTTGVAGMGGEWKFSRTRSTQTQGKYSTRGPATSRNGRLNRGRGTGNATVSSNKNFSWTINRNLTCKGRINNSCTVVTGQCRGKGYRAPKYSFRLEKSKGPVDMSPKRDPAGNPTGVSTPSGTRSAPRRPGNTFKPRNPHLPPKPRW